MLPAGCTVEVCRQFDLIRVFGPILISLASCNDLVAFNSRASLLWPKMWKMLCPKRLSRPGWTRLWATWSSCGCLCPLQGSWIRWRLKFPSNSKESMILIMLYMLGKTVSSYRIGNWFYSLWMNIVPSTKSSLKGLNRHHGSYARHSLWCCTTDTNVGPTSTNVFGKITVFPVNN